MNHLAEVLPENYFIDIQSAFQHFWPDCEEVWEWGGLSLGCACKHHLGLLRSKNEYFVGQLLFFDGGGNKKIRNITDIVEYEHFGDYRSAYFDAFDLIDAWGSVPCTGPFYRCREFLRAGVTDEEWVRLAEMEVVSAQAHVGRIYEKKGRLDQAALWYQKAADRGNPAGLFLLGWCYEKGLGIPCDYTKAIDCYEKALEVPDRAFGIAANRLGHCYEKGLGVERDDEKSFFYYQKSSYYGYPTAIFNLGYCYYNGYGTKIALDKAIEHYTRAATLNHPVAQNNLAVCYQKGKGVDENLVEAVRWLTLAAKQGLGIAQWNLALCYYEGKGVEQNIPLAIEWFEKAASNGYQDAHKGVKYCRELEREIAKRPPEIKKVPLSSPSGTARRVKAFEPMAAQLVG